MSAIWRKIGGEKIIAEKNRKNTGFSLKTCYNKGSVERRCDKDSVGRRCNRGSVGRRCDKGSVGRRCNRGSVESRQVMPTVQERGCVPMGCTGCKQVHIVRDRALMPEGSLPSVLFAAL